MNELRVPTVALPAEVICADGRALLGRIFVPAAASITRARCAPRSGSTIPAGSSRSCRTTRTGPFILNKEQLVVVERGPLPSEDAWGAGARRPRSSAGGGRWRATCTSRCPTNQQRVLDYLNQPPAFVPLYAADRLHLVHKRHVTRLTEGA